jgi:hypothetical protein
MALLPPFGFAYNVNIYYFPFMFGLAAGKLTMDINVIIFYE